jgi:ABC-type polysaccharide/polyol phosphate export permease
MTDGRVFSRWDSFRTLCLARWRQFSREREVVIWSFVFPIALSLALGLAFRNKPAETVSVALTPEAAERFGVLQKTPALRARVLRDDEAQRALRKGEVSIVVGTDASGIVYSYDDTRPEGVAARLRVDDALQRGVGRQDAVAAADHLVRELGSRYIDFVIPGLLGMNLMSGGMWGVGFHLVDARSKKLLKRLVATPMHRGDFLLAQMILRVVFMFVEVAVLLSFGHLVFHVPIRGPIVSVLFVGAIGALAFGGIGLLVASRAATHEKVTGLMNLVMIPMFICSGTFFSAERFPAAVQPLIHALPLTALNDALRAVVLDGATLVSQAGDLAILAAWGIVCFLVGLRLFKWS